MCQTDDDISVRAARAPQRLPEPNICILRTPECGSGFVLACEEFGRMVDNSFPACALIFFFNVEILSLIHI